MDYQTNSKLKGFSLLEVIVVAALLAVFAGAIGPVYRVIQTKNNLDIAAAGSVSALRRAQAAAQSGNADSDWGVKLTATSTIVFAGSSFSSRQSMYDEKLNFPGGILISGNSEIVFSKFSGTPQITGTTTLTSPFGSKDIILNGAGTINY